MEDKWKLFKNYLHNELGVCKEDIKEWTREAIKEVAENYIKHQLSENTLSNVVKRAVTNEWGKEYNYDVRKLVAEELAKQINLTVKEQQ